MASSQASASEKVRAGVGIELDDLDRRIIGILAEHGRVSNADLAIRLGVAPSTAHARTRSLVDRGVIAGFSAVVDQALLGRGLQAMIHVTLRPGARQESITAFADDVRRLPQVLQLFFVGGVDDFLVHVAVEGSSELREFVVRHLSGQASVASTRTSIIFEYRRNTVSASYR
jgi:DNA-binding Lrp family transcriptional regulator